MPCRRAPGAAWSRSSPRPPPSSSTPTCWPPPTSSPPSTTGRSRRSPTPSTRPAWSRSAATSTSPSRTPSPGPPVAICADVRDPGNAGTVIRTADAAGAGGVVLAGSSVDAYNPKTVRATVGSLFHLPVAVEPDPAAAVAAARAAGYTVLAADGAGEVDLFDADLGRSHRLALRQRGLGPARRPGGARRPPRRDPDPRPRREPQPRDRRRGLPLRQRPRAARLRTTAHRDPHRPAGRAPLGPHLVAPGQRHVVRRAARLRARPTASRSGASTATTTTCPRSSTTPWSPPGPCR